jgi:hypothetical protein
MTMVEIAIAVLCAPVVILFGVVVATVIWLLVYGSWLWLFALFGSQWALERWREL